MIAQDVTLLAGDIDQAFFERAAEAGRVAWDIETTGLDWRSARICTVQVSRGETTVGDDVTISHNAQALVGITGMRSSGRRRFTVQLQVTLTACVHMRRRSRAAG